VIRVSPWRDTPSGSRGAFRICRTMPTIARHGFPISGHQSQVAGTRFRTARPHLRTCRLMPTVARSRFQVARSRRRMARAHLQICRTMPTILRTGFQSPDTTLRSPEHGFGSRDRTSGCADSCQRLRGTGSGLPDPGFGSCDPCFGWPDTGSETAGRT